MLENESTSKAEEEAGAAKVGFMVGVDDVMLKPMTDRDELLDDVVTASEVVVEIARPPASDVIDAEVILERSWVEVEDISPELDSENLMESRGLLGVVCIDPVDDVVVVPELEELDVLLSASLVIEDIGTIAAE